MNRQLDNLLAKLNWGDTARRLRKRGKIDLPSRLRASKFVHAYLRAHPEMMAVSNPGVESHAIPMKIWMYWSAGFQSAPPIVRACRDRVWKMNPEVQIIELDDTNLSNYIGLPAYLFEKLGEDKTHLSDVIRCALLAEHGGIWVDATCYSAQPIFGLCNQATNGFLAYTRTDTFLLSSWFMASAPGNIIPRMLRDVLLTYWQTSDQLECYFWIHYLFEALYDQHHHFHATWNRRAVAKSADAHILQACLAQPFNQARMDEILALTPIQKLTYKISMPPPLSYWAHLCASVPTDETGRT